MIRHKFGAVKCEKDGIKFPSKLERDYYNRLKLLQKAGEVLFFLRQVPFDLPGGITYRLDFMVFYAHGEVELIETKGHMTKDAEIKIKQVEDIYNVNIKIVR